MSEQYWKMHSIDHPAQPEGGRGIDLYEQQLGFDREELRGKFVLELGAGPEVKFATELKDAGIDANVVLFSPDFVHGRHLGRARTKHPSGMFVPGVGQALPFREGSFDVVVSLHVLEHLGSRENFLALMREVFRVLKPGGKAYLGPTYPEDDRTYDMELNSDAFQDTQAPSVSTPHIRYEEQPEKYRLVNMYADGYRIGKGVSGRYIIEKSQE